MFGQRLLWARGTALNRKPLSARGARNSGAFRRGSALTSLAAARRVPVLRPPGMNWRAADLGACCATVPDGAEVALGPWLGPWPGANAGAGATAVWTLDLEPDAGEGAGACVGAGDGGKGDPGMGDPGVDAPGFDETCDSTRPVVAPVLGLRTTAGASVPAPAPAPALVRVPAPAPALARASMPARARRGEVPALDKRGRVPVDVPCARMRHEPPAD
jgi:hypothetical protein